MAKADLERAAKMLGEKIVSQADYDKASANHEQALSKANSIRVTIAKKNIRAPFSGRLGIRRSTWARYSRKGTPLLPCNPSIRSMSILPFPSSTWRNCTPVCPCV